MNRAQRRAAAKAQRHNRAAGMGRQGVDRYITRARRWLIGVHFDGIPIQQEQDGETIHGLTDNGDEYRHTTELETGQVQLLGELTDTWRELLRETRDGGNARHHSHDVVRCWPLVTQQRGE